MKIYIVNWYDVDGHPSPLQNRGFVNKKEAVSFRSKLNKTFKKGEDYISPTDDSKANRFVDPVSVIDIPISKKGLIRAFNM
tara:strand:- start:295 stop:537 length:243 start_codon:yes stop_codon:yes gene_type:complete